MAGSVAQNSTTSVTSGGKRLASRKSERANQSRAASVSPLDLTGEAQIPVVSRRRRIPTFGCQPLFAELARLAEMSAVERQLRLFGFRAIAGTDEVGRGSLAGPVVAAAVILDGDCSIFGVNDSKLLDPIDRRELCRFIMCRARAVAVGVVEPQMIDRVNILQASKLAMRDAVENLSSRPDILLLD